MPDKNPFSIHPCLFVAIGTNGWRILQELRQLIYEEFGQGGLPCFRYIGIESDSGKKPDDSFLPHIPLSYEQVSKVYISVPDVSVVRSKLNPKLSNDYSPGMAEWLDTSLIERGNRSYQAGAGNARQAGRMCLWANWKQFKESVAEGLDWIKDPNHHQETEDFLRKDYFAKKRRGIQPPADSLINTAPKVYIFGTLCGGTCSGSFIDIAYYVSRELGLLADVHRSIRRGVADPEVIGLFTITDLRRINDPENRKTVVNCWAALRELDFYYQKEGQYFATYPGESSFETANEPFDTIYLESLKNLAGTGFDRNDYNGLAQMSAMNLFTEVVAGLSARKDESRVNLRMTASGYLERNQNENMRAFSAFGLSAFWYPKYRIAQAINRYLAVEMCAGWLGADVQTNPIRDLVAKDWIILLADARNSLIGSAAHPQCNVNIQAAIDQSFDQGESQFLLVDEWGLEDFLVNYPNQQSTFAVRLSGPSGDYFIRMNNAEPLVAKDLKTALIATVNRYFREHTCTETKEYVAALIRCISQTVEELPNDLASISQQIEVGLAREVHQGWWAKSVFLHKEAVEEYKRSLWRTLKQRILSHLHYLRDYFLKQALNKILADMANFQNEVAQAESRLRVFRGKCEREKQELLEYKPGGHIVILAAGENNTIAEDVELGARQIMKDCDRETLRQLFNADTEPMQLLTRETESQLTSRMDRAFSPFSQNVTASFQIGQKALASSRTRIPELVDRAAPYVEAIAAFTPLPTKDAPNFLFCSDPDATSQLVVSINEKLKNARYAAADSPLDHFVIFYHEAVGLALSDLAIASRANALLTEMEKDSNRIATNFTHRQGEKMFSFKSIRDVNAVNQWVSSMKYLAPELFRTFGADLCIEYKTADGLTRALPVENSQALREYLEINGAESLTKRFITQLRALGREAVLDRMHIAWERTASIADKESLSKTHEQMLKLAFQ
jgi:hypothetical protein